ncbi:sulfotransferase ssu-1-like [Amblyomma americanum]
MDADAYREVNGVWLHNIFHEKNIRSAINYQPRSGDLFVIAYPKCGSIWTQNIVSCILTRGRPASSHSDVGLVTRFIDLRGAAAADKPSKCSPMLTHLPPAVFKPTEKAKYIYVARNPYDCAVSHYYFLKGFTPKTTADVSFERFLSIFLAGKVSYGNYFDHLVPWYEHRGDDNVLFITYEQLKADTKGLVLKIADFMGEEHGASLRQDDQLLQRIMYECSVQRMREVYQEKPEERMKKVAQATSEAHSENKKQSAEEKASDKHEGSGFVRKAVVGDWKNHFTPEQIEKTKAWIAEKTRGSDVMNLWIGLDLP